MSCDGCRDEVPRVGETVRLKASGRAVLAEEVGEDGRGPFVRVGGVRVPEAKWRPEDFERRWASKGDRIASPRGSVGTAMEDAWGDGPVRVSVDRGGIALSEEEWLPEESSVLPPVQPPTGEEDAGDPSGEGVPPPNWVGEGDVVEHYCLSGGSPLRGVALEDSSGERVLVRQLALPPLECSWSRENVIAVIAANSPRARRLARAGDWASEKGRWGALAVVGRDVLAGDASVCVRYEDGSGDTWPVERTDLWPAGGGLPPSSSRPARPSWVRVAGGSGEVPGTFPGCPPEEEASGVSGGSPEEEIWVRKNTAVRNRVSGALGVTLQDGIGDEVGVEVRRGEDGCCTAVWKRSEMVGMTHGTPRDPPEERSLEEEPRPRSNAEEASGGSPGCLPDGKDDDLPSPPFALRWASEALRALRIAARLEGDHGAVDAVKARAGDACQALRVLEVAASEGVPDLVLDSVRKAADSLTVVHQVLQWNPGGAADRGARKDARDRSAWAAEAILRWNDGLGSEGEG